MGQLEPYAAASPPLLRDARRAARTASRYQAQTQVRVAGIDMETDTSIAKVDSSTAVTAHALAAATRLAQLHKQLEALAPEVSGRLAALCDAHAISMIELAADHQRTLRRW